MAQFSLAMVMYALMTTMAEYVTGLGATAAVAGAVSGAYIVGGLCSRLYSSKAMVNYGWKRIVMIFAVLHFLACCGYFFAGSIPVLLLIRFVHGLGFGASANAIMVIGMSGLPKKRYGEAVGYFMMSTSLGVAVGPFAGGLIYDRFGGNGCFAAALFFSLLTVLFMSAVNTKDTDPYYRKKELQEIDALPKAPQYTGIDRLIETKALPISCCIALLCFGYAALMSFYRLYAETVSLNKEFSCFFLIYAATLLISRPMAGRFQDRYGDNAVCYPCMFFQFIGIALLAWKPCMLTIVLCAVGGALGYGTMNSTLNAIANRTITAERRPYAVTTYWAFSDLGVGVSPAILGGIVTAGGYSVMYFSAALVSFLALPVYYIAWGRKQKMKKL